MPVRPGRGSPWMETDTVRGLNTTWFKCELGFEFGLNLDVPPADLCWDWDLRGVSTAWERTVP